MRWAGAVKEHRRRRAMTQQQLGKLLGSSQSRIAKMEAGDASVSIDLMVRSLLRMGPPETMSLLVSLRPRGDAPPDRQTLSSWVFRLPTMHVPGDSMRRE